ncbi:alpha/beta fold hydrolase [Chamaesiphon polymorphus]|uniref:Alpha/beta hydrolase n=1 Tax=Chamaesiphon polymorphus CCALA 037 TaxID=2107692 RepID=A0A2T1FTM6_9CYAN|nr:alpha/beta hydrolase [Chamaesiphon polymorphus]PSB48343.1 alpha/beta hydrolase [Chamaesiphon polymorphus CCALA 037]
MFLSLSLIQIVEIVGLAATTLYHQIASYRDRRSLLPPGKLVTLNDRGVRHICLRGTGEITVVVDASLGGVEGYLLIDELAKITRVCIYDRAGYGWSSSSSQPRTSQQIIHELDELLTIAEIHPPYILVGDSFGSYNLRLYAHRYPDRLRGLVLTDGLHEDSMLNLPLSVGLLKAFFTLSFGFVAIGAALGIVRVLGEIGVFELIKPELKKIPVLDRQYVKRSFYFARHWLTMGREMWNLDTSGRQLKIANRLGDLPIVSIKSQTFLRPLFGIKLFSLPAADRVRDRIHLALLQLSTNTQQVQADRSSHFVWIDQPETIVAAVADLVKRAS